MKRLACVLVSVLCLLAAGLPPLAADDIRLGAFPPGTWLDSRWQAYWVFGPDSIRLLDVRDQEIYDFKGIVQNLKVVKTATGRRLSFDCAQARRSYLFETRDGDPGLKMVIRPAGSAIAYTRDLPAVSDRQLADYKQAVSAAKPAELARVVAAIEAQPIDPAAAAKSAAGPDAGQSRQTQLAEASAARLLELAQSDDFAALDRAAAAAGTAGLLDLAIAALEAAAAKPDSLPAVFVALSAAYGRKGLKTQEYAALEQAEAASRPGVAFSIALVHGRKQLLAGAPDAASFLVGSLDIQSEPAGAAVTIDGVEAGSTPCLIPRLKAGPHELRLALPGFQALERRLELGVGRSIELREVLAPRPVLAISLFGFPVPAATGVIDEAAHTITVGVPFATDRSGLRAYLKHSGDQVAPPAGMALDYRQPVSYRVTDADGHHLDYLVSVVYLPQVETTAIAGNPELLADLGGNSARGGGTVKNEGNSPVSARGLCWNTAGAPTVADRLATDGAGSGTYSDCRMTGLEPDTVYHVRAWASNREGTAYGPELSFNSGKILGSGFGGGLVFYNDGAGHGLVAAAENQSKPTIVWWLANQKKDTKATATGIGSGAANTARIVAALGDTSFTAGGLAKSYRGGGFADWFLPSQEELKLMFANLHARGLGGFSNNYYWSSSAQTGRFPAFAQNFGDPDRSIDATAYGLDFCVRAARAF